MRARQDLQRDLERLLATDPVAAASPSAVRVGMAALSSGPWHLALQILLAHALRLRGATSQLWLCDLPGLPICNERLATSRSVEHCDGCLADKRVLLGASGLDWQGMSAFAAGDAVDTARATVSALRDDQLRTYCEGSWPIGQWLDVSAAHYLRRDGTGNDAEQVATRRRLLISAIVTLQAAERWLDRFQPTVVVAQGGVHFMWRIVRELAAARNIPVVCREMGKGGWDHHLYALDRDSMAPDLDEPWLAARQEPLTTAEAAAVDAFLDQLPSRTFASAAVDDRPSVAPPSSARRTIVAFANVTWDMATATRDVGFAGMSDWLNETLRIAGALPDVHLIVRAHPAEAGNSREHVVDDLLRDSRGVSRSVTLIPPGDGVSAASLCDRADLVTVYNSTAGLEAAARGKPVLVGGRPHFRGRGFTIDVDSREHYRAMLQAWALGSPLDLDTGARELARRYVHMFFLRYHVAMGWTTSPIEPPFALTIRSMRQLAPGANPILDVVCDGIVDRRQILLPRALSGAHACER